MLTIEDLPPYPFRVADAAEHGLTPGQCHRAVDAGLLIRRTRGVYSRSDLEDTIETRTQVLSLVLSPHHVVTDRTAAWLWGVDIWPLGEKQSTPPIESCALRGHQPTIRPEAAGRTRDLLPRDIAEIDGVRATTPLRTALDLGCNLHRRDAYAAMCELARVHGLTAKDLSLELPRFKRRRGVVQCRSLVPLIDVRLESHREAWTLLEILDAGLPRPEPQWWIVIDDVPTYRLDFAYVNAKVCVEYNGEEFHDRTEEQRANDRARWAWLRAHGWRIIIVKRGDFTGRSRNEWIQMLRHALAPSYTNRRW